MPAVSLFPLQSPPSQRGLSTKHTILGDQNRLKFHIKNHVDLIGFIGSDPESRQLENGTQLIALSLATQTSWKNHAGTYDSRTDWHRVVVWGKLVQFASTLSRGAHIEVEGQLRHRTYQKQVQAGKKTVAVDVSVAEIHASVIRKLDRNGSSANSGEEDVPEPAPE
jgi:single-strand DNA-binding protein